MAEIAPSPLVESLIRPGLVIPGADTLQPETADFAQPSWGARFADRINSLQKVGGAALGNTVSFMHDKVEAVRSKTLPVLATAAAAIGSMAIMPQETIAADTPSVARPADFPNKAVADDCQTAALSIIEDGGWGYISRKYDMTRWDIQTSEINPICRYYGNITVTAYPTHYNRKDRAMRHPQRISAPIVITNPLSDHLYRRKRKLTHRYKNPKNEILSGTAITKWTPDPAVGGKPKQFVNKYMSFVG